MGFGLAVIKDILAEYGDTASLEKYLSIQAAQKQVEIAGLEKQYLLLQNTIRGLKDAHNYPDATSPSRKFRAGSWSVCGR